MMKWTTALTLACASLLPALLGSACSPAAPDPAGDLAATERLAIRAAAWSAGGFTQASGIGQNAAIVQEPAGAAQPGSLTFGTCPQVTTTATLGSSLLDISIEFGTGCAIPVAPDYTCSGSASGQLEPSTGTLDLSLDAISCSGDTGLTGNVSLTYALSPTALNFTGEWDLTYTTEGQSIVLYGQGATSYSIPDSITTVSSFDGLLATDGNDWNLTLDSILVSYANKRSYLPYGGTMTASGRTIRQLVVQFNENSPSTGEVQVSVDGSAFFTVNLYEL
jgi:hypothetical protein